MQSGLLKAIRFFGSQKALAKALGVRQQSVSNWLNRQCHIPYIHVIKIVCATKGYVTTHELAPNNPLNDSIYELIKVLPQKTSNNFEEVSSLKQSKESVVLKDDSYYGLGPNLTSQRRKINYKVNNQLRIRDYVKVCPQFWQEVTNKNLKKFSGMPLIVALYLQTCHHANMVGVYHLPLSYIAYDTGLSLKKILSALEYLQQVNFCSYDKSKEYIWVHDMGMDQMLDKIRGFVE